MKDTGVRRPGYAPTTSAVGRRGMHTRERILEASANLFAANGFHGTSIEDVARAVGGSRAVVYQYFPSKDAIFVELARDCERAVLQHGGQLTDLGPDAAGLARLRDWLHEWERLYDRFATVFLEFPGIGPVSGRPQADAEVVSARYTRVIADRLGRTPISGLTADVAAEALLRIAHMTNLYRYRKLFDLPAGEAFSDSLSIAIQLLLFPDTPSSVITAVIPDHARTLALPVHDGASVTAPPDAVEPSITRRDILQASATLFTERGYYAVGMPDIREAAGISRATLYRHFSTKMDILAELTALAIDDGTTLSNALADIARTDPTPAALRAWLGSYVGFHRRFGGVIRAWYDGTLREQLAAQVAQGILPFRHAALDVLQRMGLPGRLDPAVAATVFLAVIGRTSDIAIASHDGRSDDDTADFMLTLLRRSLAIA